MDEIFKEIFKVLPPRDIIFAVLVMGLMYLNWHKDKLINNLTDTVRDLSNDVSVLSELLRTLVYGRPPRKGP